MNSERTLKWEPRRIPGYGKIVIGGQTVESSRLDKEGTEVVPAGAEVVIYQMDAAML